MERCIKEFKGHSGSEIYLMQNDSGYFVRKVNNVKRNFERLKALEHIVKVPKVYDVTYLYKSIDMEYIHGMDMITYLKHNDVDKLIDFIKATFMTFDQQSRDFDYEQVYEEMLGWIDDVHDLPFKADDLIRKLPKALPASPYHGDFTLENMIYSDDMFYLIDPVTIKYDSWVFDLTKLRQDVECKWFLRHNDAMLDVKLNRIHEAIKILHPEADNNYLLIAMLLRVYLHCEKNSLEYHFIMKEIYRLWK